MQSDLIITLNHIVFSGIFRMKKKKTANWQISYSCQHWFLLLFLRLHLVSVNFRPCVRAFDISHWFVLPCVLKQTYVQLTQALKWPNTVNELSFFAHHLHNMHSGMLQWQLQQLTSCLDVSCPMPQGTAIMSMLIRLYAYREQLNDLTSL